MCPPPVPILSQINPAHSPTSHFLEIHLNIILPSTPGSSKYLLPLRFPHQNPAYTSSLSRACSMPRPSHSVLFYRPNNISASWLVKLICSQITWHRIHPTQSTTANEGTRQRQTCVLLVLKLVGLAAWRSGSPARRLQIAWHEGQILSKDKNAVAWRGRCESVGRHSRVKSQPRREMWCLAVSCRVECEKPGPLFVK